MTVETEVANLTTAVDNLTSAVNVKKATLDASVADAETARDASQSARDTAATHKTAAEAAATSATTTAAALTGFDLDAIAASKAVTATDVFVYDTSKDSDGGAWRNRCQHTSWYNETLNTATRGNRREFPAVAVIVAEADKVTIYDGDDPALPMWMVVSGTTSARNLGWSNGGNNTAVCALGGKLVFGDDNAAGDCGGVMVADFIADLLTRYTITTSQGGTGLNVSQRNDSVNLPARLPTDDRIVNAVVNDVAMTVLPNAPVDPATGLPVPTIAVATSGGVSVIKDDGNVWDITGTNWGATANGVIFNGSELYFLQGVYYWIACDLDGLTQDHHLADGYNTSVDDYPFTRIMKHEKVAFAGAWKSCAVGQGGFDLAHYSRHLHPFDRLVQHKIGEGFDGNMVAYATPDFNTGWMPGDIKFAGLADTDTASLVGANLRTDPFDVVTDWAKIGANADTLASVGGEAHLTKDATASADAQFEVTMAVTAGDYVSASCDGWRVSGVGAARLDLYNQDGSTIARAPSYATTATHKRLHVEGVATGSLVRVRITCGGGASAGVAGFDNLTVDIADADRSVNNTGAIVNGTVTRTPVATGAELVGYFGTENSGNYLRLPPNEVNDLGTEWTIVTWKKQLSASVWDFWLCMSLGDGTNIHGTSFGTTNLGFWKAGNGINAVSIPGARNTEIHQDVDGWHQIAYVGDASGVKVYADGELDGSISTTLDLTFPSADYQWFIGGEAEDASNSNSIHDGRAKNLALLRMSSTAVTADQIRKMYEDEKVLFQENAACTLYGTSDAVTALAHDEETGLLHVGTSAGRSDFQGLRRVSNTTTAVSTAISAVDGLIVEQ